MEWYDLWFMFPIVSAILIVCVVDFKNWVLEVYNGRMDTRRYIGCGVDGNCSYESD